MSVNPPPAKRGRPPRIDRADIVGAAFELGLDSFSLAEVAQALQVSTPALYSHVDGRDHILRLAAAEVMTRLEPTLLEIDDWQEWLRRWAEQIRAELGAVGEEVLEAVRTNLDPTALRIAEHGMHLLTSAGFDPAEAGYTMWLVVRVACTAGPLGRASVDGPVRQAAAVAGGTTSPEMRSAIDAVATADSDSSFAFDVEVVIAGLAARQRARQE
ncbi:MAG: TetR/AcrR family transcriptional regulator C-terminal domain-containing protein [Acidimicrobiales bacterium]